LGDSVSQEIPAKLVGGERYAMRLFRQLGFAALVVLPFACNSKPYEGKSVSELEQMLRNPDPAVQAQGAFGLSQMGPAAREAVPALVECLKKESIVRQKAALALGAIGEDASESVPALAELLRDPEWTVRRQAAMALGRIGPAAGKALPELERLKLDPDTLVRKAAAEALRRVRAK
jgi:HEAT repeat protein